VAPINQPTREVIQKRVARRSFLRSESADSVRFVGHTEVIAKRVPQVIGKFPPGCGHALCHIAEHISHSHPALTSQEPLESSTMLCRS
jgi:hypothetical protein